MSVFSHEKSMCWSEIYLVRWKNSIIYWFNVMKAIWHLFIFVELRKYMHCRFFLFCPKSIFWYTTWFESMQCGCRLPSLCTVPDILGISLQVWLVMVLRLGQHPSCLHAGNLLPGQVRLLHATLKLNSCHDVSCLI